ncbi:MAG TPA: DUF4179 domain-containing protein [Anaerolineales bacterium]|nr:DUF4179 domain-containing protein [Anaerolineales bacterium]
MQQKPVLTSILLSFILLVVSCQSFATQPVETQVEVDNMTLATMDVSQETSSIAVSQTINGITLTIDWFLADAKRVSFGYTIEGLPDVPDAVDLFGSVQLVEKSGTGELGWGGHSTINRVEGSPGMLAGSWSSVFAEPFMQPKGQFDLDITLGHGGMKYDTNFSIASFPIPEDATPYPPNVFPPKLPDHKVGDFHFDFETEIYPLLELSPSQSVTANNIEMRLEKLEITASFTVAILCYTKPSSKDWMTSRSILGIGDHEEMNNTYSLLFDSDYGGYQGLSPEPADSPKILYGRCIQSEFLIGHSNNPGTITLTIPALEQSVPEVIPEDEIAAAREKLIPQGIDIGWEVVSFPGGGGGSGPVYSKLPDGMTEIEAYQLFLEALGYIHQGPWEFRIDVDP